VARRTSGVIYKQALQYLSVGLITIILTMSALQYFRAIIPRDGHVTINGALIMVFAIYAVNAVGGILLAIGARRLKRIEEI
jgi:membrane glycosyltransferase